MAVAAGIKRDIVVVLSLDRVSTVLVQLAAGGSRPRGRPGLVVPGQAGEAGGDIYLVLPTRAVSRTVHVA
jgi:hypothetical protein